MNMLCKIAEAYGYCFCLFHNLCKLLPEDCFIANSKENEEKEKRKQIMYCE
jgi:hypothetical protein